MTKTNAKGPRNAGPLADLVVIEMGTLIAGPFCGQLFGDFGAEVIKLEDPRIGDPMRRRSKAGFLPTVTAPLQSSWPLNTILSRRKRKIPPKSP